ncbi:branched-chain amino acid ABC transporter substrate-binding protein [Pendulispora rubella]|uniref:Branched-chain amino acid ABC transporter substrate-binding protein n=1 Tax=Pendulispora rubella TaxID=2741070 RepID=A0ABZ2L267_9BACT
MSVSACKKSGGDEGGAIKIGVPVPLSGDSASAGQDILAAAKTAAAEINEAGGIKGRKIEIVEADDACTPQQSAQAAQKLVNSGVVAAAGGYCSGAAVPAAPIFGRANVPFVLDASTNPVLTDDGQGKVFRTCGRDDRQGEFAAKFIVDTLHAKRVAILHDNTTYAKGLAEAANASIKKNGQAEVAYLDALTAGQSDYTPVLTKIAGLKPDVLYFTGYFAEAGLLLKQRKQLGLTFQMVGGDATTDASALRTAGDTAEGFIATTAPLPTTLPAAADFVRRYKALNNGSEPGPFSAYEYDAIKVLAKAIEKGGTTDLIKTLHGLEEQQGITGSIAFDEKGDRKTLTFIAVTVQAGKYTAYKP